MDHEFQFFTDPDEYDASEFQDSGEERTLKVRLDKWLWAARFFKTRALARAAVENGKIYYNGERSKPSREIEIDAILQIRHGRFEKTVIVKGLSTRRRSTEEALALFEETEESRENRENSQSGYGAGSYDQPQQNFINPYRPIRSPNYHQPEYPGQGQGYQGQGQQGRGYQGQGQQQGYPQNHGYQGQGQRQHGYPQGQGYQGQGQQGYPGYPRHQGGYQGQGQQYPGNQGHHPYQGQPHQGYQGQGQQGQSGYPGQGYQGQPGSEYPPRERRPVRFLRRSFNRANEQQPVRQEHPTPYPQEQYLPNAPRECEQIED